MNAASAGLQGIAGLGGRTLVVTGGASGLGAAIAEAGVAAGATVAVIDLDADGATTVVNRIGAQCAIVGDVSDAASVSAAVATAIDRLGRIDVLVNSAGIARLAPAEELVDADWDASLAVNLTGTFLMSRAVGRTMIDNGFGRIITIASQAGSVAIEKHAAYCATKFGVIGLTRVLALEWGRHGITANTISPTVVMTELGRKAWDNPAGDAMREQIPVGRFAEPAEIAAAAMFLASDGAAMINGADLVVDGGFTIH